MRPGLRDRIHDVNSALVALHVELLGALEEAVPGTAASYEMSSILEATDALRRAFGEFVEATVLEEEKAA